MKSVDHGIEVEDWFPIFTKNIETNIPRRVDVGMVDLRSAPELRRKNFLSAANFGRLVRVFISDGKGEMEGAALVHAFQVSDLS